MKTKFKQSKSKNINDTQPINVGSNGISKSRKFRALRKFRVSNSHEDFVSFKIEMKHIKVYVELKRNNYKRKKEYF